MQECNEHEEVRGQASTTSTSVEDLRNAKVPLDKVKKMLKGPRVTLKGTGLSYLHALNAYRNNCKQGKFSFLIRCLDRMICIR